MEDLAKYLLGAMATLLDCRILSLQVCKTRNNLLDNFLVNFIRYRSTD